MALALSRAAPAAQDPARSIGDVLDTLDRVRAFHETAISPDGRRVAWVEDVSAADGDDGDLHPRSAGPAEPRRVTAATDGRTTRRTASPGRPTSHAGVSLRRRRRRIRNRCTWLRRDGAVPARRRLTNVTGQLAHPLWSPDGKSLAILFVAGSTQETGALVAYKPDAGVVGDVVEEQRIAIVDLASGSGARGQPGEHVRVRLRLVARRPGVRGRGGARARARTTTGSRSSTSCAPTPARRRRSGSRRCRSPDRAGRRTASRSRSFTAS